MTKRKAPAADQPASLPPGFHPIDPPIATPSGDLVAFSMDDLPPGITLDDIDIHATLDDIEEDSEGLPLVDDILDKVLDQQSDDEAADAADGVQQVRLVLPATSCLPANQLRYRRCDLGRLSAKASRGLRYLLNGLDLTGAELNGKPIGQDKGPALQYFLELFADKVETA